MANSPRIFLSVIILILLSQPIFADFSPIGLECLERFSDLPYLWWDAETRQVSSHDRTGANSDRGNYLGTYLGENVLFDEVGPGCIYRMWCTNSIVVDGDMRPGLTGNLKCYFDGETTPRVSMQMSDFFSGDIAPFLSPLVDDYTVSSGGWYSYLPLPFAKSLKITTTAANLYYNFTYQKYSEGANVSTFTGTENSSALRAKWNASASDPNSRQPNRVVKASINATGQRVTQLAEITGPGVITSFRLSIPEIAPNDDAGRYRLTYARLKIYWDEDPANPSSLNPAVNVPIGLFFGSGFGEVDFKSLPIGMSTANPGWYYCYFPMPFSKKARIVIDNTGSYTLSPVSCEISVSDDPEVPYLLASRRIGRFRAQGSSCISTGPNDVPILDATGSGAFVGYVIAMEGPAGGSRAHLEGDERIHIDGSLSPAVYGTGTEDFVNAGWYFDSGAPFNLPMHGLTQIGKNSYSAYTHCIYRFFQGDKIHFSNSIKVGLEHGRVNDVIATYNTCAYYYHLDGSELSLSDTVDVGNYSSESAHNYTVQGQTWSGNRTSYYGGDNDTVSVTDNGRTFTGSSSFNAAISPANSGVKLRCRLDYGIANQKAEVKVDGQLVGAWYNAGANSSKRWLDTHFTIPEKFTKGKSNIRIEIKSAAGSQWNEYRYDVYSVCERPVHLLVNNCNAAKELPDNTAVRISGRVVTAVFQDGFYVSDPERTSGIKVKSNAAVSEGDIIYTAGELATESGERVLRNASVYLYQSQ